MKACLIFVTILTLLLGISGPVRAQEIVCPKPSGDPEYNKNEARSYYNMGNTFFTMKQYEKSAASFVCVINLVPYSIMARYRLGKSYDALGRFALAREQYQWILADASDEASVLKTEVQKRLDEIKNLADKAVAPVPADPKAGVPEDPGAKPVVDVPETPKEPQPPTTPDPKVGGAPGPDAGSPRPSLTASEPSLTSRWWFWTGIGSTVVFTGAALFGGMQALKYQDRWESDWNPADRDSLKDYRLVTDLAIGGAVISAAALGIALWLTLPDATPKTSKATSHLLVLPACGPDGCMMTLSWGF